MTTRTFTPAELDAIGVPFECDTEPEDGFATELHREQIATRRWVSVHRLVFRAPDDGKTYRVAYEQGLTEHQDGLDPWNGDSTVVATEVAQVPVTVQEWRPVGDQPALTAPWRTIARLVAWLDDHNGRGDAEVGLRLLKITEEAGEVAQAWIGMYGQNPRKGITHTPDDLAGELCDVIVAAMVALASVSGDPAAHFERKVAQIAAGRLGDDQAPAGGEQQ